MSEPYGMVSWDESEACQKGQQHKKIGRNIGRVSHGSYAYCLCLLRIAPG